MYMQLEKEDWDILSDLAFKIAAIIIDEIEEGADPDKEADFEEKLLYLKMSEQLDFMEVKYGPHPLILDTKADIIKDLNEKIRLKEEARALCFQSDYELRGILSKELAELYFEDKHEIEKAGQLIDEAILDLKKCADSRELEEAQEIQAQISSIMKLKNE